MGSSFTGHLENAPQGRLKCFKWCFYSTVLFIFQVIEVGDLCFITKMKCSFVTVLRVMALENQTLHECGVCVCVCARARVCLRMCVSVCVCVWWLVYQPHLARGGLIRLWVWVRLHTCCSLTNQCATG